MSHLYFVSVMTTAFCSGCPAQHVDDRPVTVMNDNEVVTTESEPVTDAAMTICVVPAALTVDPTLPIIAEAVANYWTEQGYPVRLSTPGDGCLMLLDVQEEAIAKTGWGFKEAQTWIPNTITETNPVLVRFRQGFWVDPISTQELKAALAAHEIGHVFLGAQHEPEATGKLMSAIVTEDVAQALFAGKL
jgi:hypothetical protein